MIGDLVGKAEPYTICFTNFLIKSSITLQKREKKRKKKKKRKVIQKKRSKRKKKRDKKLLGKIRYNLIFFYVTFLCFYLSEEPPCSTLLKF